MDQGPGIASWPNGSPDAAAMVGDTEAMMLAVWLVLVALGAVLLVAYGPDVQARMNRYVTRAVQVVIGLALATMLAVTWVRLVLR